MNKCVSSDGQGAKFKFSKIAFERGRMTRGCLEPALLAAKGEGERTGESTGRIPRRVRRGAHEESIDKFSGHRKQCGNNVNYAPGTDRRPLQLIGWRARARATLRGN